MKIFKNRMVLGITCIVISMLICFGITPLINAGLSKKAVVVRMKTDVPSGVQLTREMMEEAEVGSYNLPPNVFHSISDAEGMFLTADVCVGDYLFPSKVSAEAGLENNYLYNLTGEKQAMSITIERFSQGLSGKLKSGDIVSVIAPDFQKSKVTVIPPELRYVEVIAVTANSGYDANVNEQRSSSEDEDKELPSTVTLLVKPEQSTILAELEEEGTIHLSLVYRGPSNTAKLFIEAQDVILEEIKAAKEAEELEEEDGETEGDSSESEAE